MGMGNTNKVGKAFTYCVVGRGGAKLRERHEVKWVKRSEGSGGPARCLASLDGTLTGRLFRVCEVSMWVKL